jgi:signal transduction histidine kinase
LPPATAPTTVPPASSLPGSTTPPAGPALGGIAFPGPAVLALAGLLLLLTVATPVAVALLNRRAARRATAAERRRLQREIHDGLQQTVVGLQAQLETLEDHPELAATLASRLTEQSQVLLQEVRAVVHGPGIVVQELDGEIRRAAESLQAAGIPVLHKVLGDPWPLTPFQAHEVAMILREALCNIQKHGRGTVGVLVFLHFAAQSLVLEVVDTGQGFDLEAAAEGAGLQSMRERAQRLRGQLEVFTEERGTTVRLTLPRWA